MISLNEALKQEQLAIITQGKTVVRQNHEIAILKESLFELVDSRGEYRGKVKDEIVQEFCKSERGECWFVELVSSCCLWL